MESTFTGGKRFSLLSQLGQGGMGIVYEALDQDCGARVALKTMRELSGDQVLRLKHEFRALRNIAHPNLVTLGELYQENGSWFFTMELVNGVDFFSYTRSGDSFDEKKLRAAFADVLRGLAALHGIGLVHRDIKPHNILVTEQSRAVLVDFGLCSTKLETQPGDRDYVLGTARYMAPEQGTSKLIGPESDMYSAGVVLYEALIGTAPVVAELKDILRIKQTFVPDEAVFDEGSVPEDLKQACIKLLQPDPSRRPTALGAMEMLSVSESVVGKEQRRRRRSTPPFTGRRLELSRLLNLSAKAAGGKGQCVLVHGDSGIGKTALLDELDQRIRRENREALVIRSRSRERETVPYKAFDDIADSLAVFLKEDRQDRIVLPESFAQLLGSFPAFASVSASKEKREGALASVSREELFAAFRDLILAVSKERFVSIFFDDLQWADDSSLALLNWLVMESDTLFIIATATSITGKLERVFSRAQRIPLKPLSTHDAVALAGRFLDYEKEGKVALSAQLMAMESRGNPAFMRELVQYATARGSNAWGTARLEDALSDRLKALPLPARRILDLVSVVGGPVSQEVISSALDIGSERFTEFVSHLCANDFLRTTGAEANGPLEPKHRLVRETVQSQLTASMAVELHERLAVAMEESGVTDESILAEHWAGCGEQQKAAMYCFLAAEQANEVGAYERAAELYQRAISLSPDVGARLWELQAKRATALANSGRGILAGEAFLLVSKLVPVTDSIKFRLQAAEQFLLAGDFQQGVMCFDSVLPALQLPKIEDSRRWTGTFSERISIRLGRARIREATADKVDVCYSVAKGLVPFDFGKAMHFQNLHFRLAQELREPYRLSRALSVEASMLALGGLSPKKALREAKELAALSKEPQAYATADLSGALVFLLRGRFQDSVRMARGAEVTFKQHCTGLNWEVANAQGLILVGQAMLGEVRELCKRQRAVLFDARERGDRTTEANCKLGYLNLPWLVKNRPKEARQAVAEARNAKHENGMRALLADVHIDLYCGDGTAGRNRVIGFWSRLQRSSAYRLDFVKNEAWFLRGRASLGAITSEGTRYKLCRDVENMTRKLSEQGSVVALAYSHALRGSLAVHCGNREEALYEFRAGEETARMADMRLLAFSIQRQRGLVLGRNDGEHLVREADEWMASQGIKEPGRMANIWSPTGMLP